MTQPRENPRHRHGERVHAHPGGEAPHTHTYSKPENYGPPESRDKAMGDREAQRERAVRDVIVGPQRSDVRGG